MKTRATTKGRFMKALVLDVCEIETIVVDEDVQRARPK